MIFLELRKSFKVIKYLRGQTAERDRNGSKIRCSETGLGMASHPNAVGNQWGRTSVNLTSVTSVPPGLQCETPF